MKKTAALLLSIVLLLCTSAFALVGTNYPTWDGASTPADSLYGFIGDQRLQLSLDNTADYSNVTDSLAQVCFFAFDQAQQHYLEMYLLLPEDAKAGDVFSAQSGSMSSVSLYEVSKDSEELYFSGQVSGIAYPDGSSFELRIDAAEKSDSALFMSGSLSGTLIKFDGDNPTAETLSISEIQFSFTLPLNTNRAPQSPVLPENSAVPEASPQIENTPKPESTPQIESAPQSTQATPDPHPAFTLPPDYATL